MCDASIWCNWTVRLDSIQLSEQQNEIVQPTRSAERFLSLRL